MKLHDYGHWTLIQTHEKSYWKPGSHYPTKLPTYLAQPAYTWYHHGIKTQSWWEVEQIAKEKGYFHENT